MNKTEILNQAYAKAYEYEQKYGCCPQCVIAALQETIGGIDDHIFQAVHGLAGGSALVGSGTCGALAGGIVCIGAYFGRTREDFTKGLDRTAFNLSKLLVEEFKSEFGDLTCQGVQKARFGRSFDMWNPQELKLFFDLGGHDDKCPLVAGRVAMWTAEIILESGEQKR